MRVIKSEIQVRIMRKQQLAYSHNPDGFLQVSILIAILEVIAQTI